MDSQLLPELRIDKSAHLFPFNFPFHAALYRRCIAGVVGLAVLCLPFVMTALVVHLLGPGEPVESGAHLVFWLIVSIGVASAFALAALGVAALNRSARRTFTRILLRKVAERERELFVEIERDLSWLGEDELTQMVNTP